ncbi:MAG: hypothetical protein Kow0056_05590 [Coriobacteriia bacterium]
MGFFRWAAPIFSRFGDRWDEAAVQRMAASFESALTDDCRCILDVGGGTGALAARLADALEAQVTVLDPSEDMLAYAPSRDDIRVVLGRAETMPFEDDAFDGVIVTDAFHHFADIENATAEFARVVRDGGVVQVHELDPDSWLIRAVAVAEKALREPAAFLTPREMEELMARHGIHGASEPHGRFQYVFTGHVRRQGQSRSQPSDDHM